MYNDTPKTAAGFGLAQQQQPTANECAREPELKRAIDQLGAIAQQLQQRLVALDERLSPVMTPVPPMQQSDKVIERDPHHEYRSGLGAVLGNITLSLLSCSAHIDMIGRRLEV
jgi:hypothetical protein